MPQLSAEALASRLAKGNPVPVILLLGEDVYLRAACRDQIVETSVEPAARQWGVSRFSAAEGELAHALGQARMMPMLVPRQVIILSELEGLDRGPEEAREAALADLSEYLSDPAPFTVLLLEAGALDQRMKLAKLMAEKAQVVSVTLPQDQEERARIAGALVMKIARDKQTPIDSDAAEDLVDLCNANLTAIGNELEKLATYVGAGKTIQCKDVAALVISEKRYSVWELTEMLASRDRRSALTFLNNLLREGEQPPALIGAMAWMYRKLMEAQALGPRVNGFEAAGRLKMRKNVAEIALRAARKIPREKLAAGMRALYEADSRLKSGASDDTAVMEFLVAALIDADPARKAG
jgi:DNA polymerase-3 subunit delta